MSSEWSLREECLALASGNNVNRVMQFALPSSLNRTKFANSRVVRTTLKFAVVFWIKLKRLAFQNDFVKFRWIRQNALRPPTARRGLPICKARTLDDRFKCGKEATVEQVCSPNSWPSVRVECESDRSRHYELCKWFDGFIWSLSFENSICPLIAINANNCKLGNGKLIIRIGIGGSRVCTTCENTQQLPKTIASFANSFYIVNHNLWC